MDINLYAINQSNQENPPVGETPTIDSSQQLTVEWNTMKYTRFELKDAGMIPHLLLRNKDSGIIERV